VDDAVRHELGNDDENIVGNVIGDPRTLKPAPKLAAGDRNGP
jgi:hypothetical protein